jgi:lipoyl(octanoyl) transferase
MDARIIVPSILASNLISMQCRVPPFDLADGPTNMGLDEALLESAAADPSAAAVLRFYGWSKPTLSLGYFQAAAEVDQDPRWRDVPLVRRLTGGGAIWHDREITYSLVVPRSHPAASNAVDLYITVHDAIARTISELGATARRRGETSARNGLNRPFLCFTDQDPRDIVVADSKIVGSAQRRRMGAVLQHGSILLDTSPVTPELRGLSAFCGERADEARWSTALRAKITNALALVACEDPISAAERRRADELAKRVYSNRDWIHRR